MSRWPWLAALAAAAGLCTWLLLTDWEQGDGQPAHAVPAASAERGADLLYEYGCGSCHLIPGLRHAEGMVGPPLTEWSARGYIAGRLSNTPDNLVRWIMDPGGVEPGTAMPDLGVPLAEARHMAAYLYTVGDASRPGPPHPISASWLHRLGEFRPLRPND